MRPSKKPQVTERDYRTGLTSGLANLIFQRIKHGKKRHQNWLKKMSNEVAAEWFS